MARRVKWEFAYEIGKGLFHSRGWRTRRAARAEADKLRRQGFVIATEPQHQRLS